MEKGIIGIGSDHAGFHLKRELKHCISAMGYGYVDCGTHSDTPSVDYPDIALTIANGLLNGRFGLGILICTTGIGMSIAANRFPGIRAALCLNEEMAKLSREHNDANILILGSKFLSPPLASSILKTWISTKFTYGRHVRRIEKLDKITHAEFAQI